MELRGTTILAVRTAKGVALGGDGQVTMGQTMIMKHTARKVRRLYKGRVWRALPGPRPTRSRCSNASRPNWRKAEAICCAPPWKWPKTGVKTNICVSWKPCCWWRTRSAPSFSPVPGMLLNPMTAWPPSARGPYALAAARALLRHGEMSPADMVREAMAIAADICVFTNGNLTLEVLDAE